MEHRRGLFQAIRLAWFWFAGALVSFGVCLILSITVSVPATVLNVLPCTYHEGRYYTAPGSQALVLTADQHDHYTFCKEGHPFTIGQPTQLDQSLFGGDPIPVIYPAVTLLLTFLLFEFGVQVVRQELRRQERLHQSQHVRHARHPDAAKTSAASIHSSLTTPPRLKQRIKRRNQGTGR